MVRKIQAPRNTATREGGAEVFVDALRGGSDGAVERQEARGQADFVESDTLPTGYNGNKDAKKLLEAAGVKFGRVVPNDDLFQYVVLPKGWKKVPTDHDMWSKLVDDKGRERAAIFYKAAFYDRRAHMDLVHRFGLRQDYDREEKEDVAVFHITDCGKVIHTTEPIKLPDSLAKKYEVSDKARQAATAWLDKKYPDWQNAAAYWD